ncbi:MAG TPA: hypothetical protein VEZ40_09985 [Pyrinomonadaceae bacterium]|nr:hypothetical protein [Pyrinomonadaceae bacterium]
MSDETRLEGRVAQILNARELIINIGSEGGIKPKMKFAVLSEYPLEVVDPTTKEVLDVVDREKVRVEVSEIRPRIAICRTYRVKRITGGALYQGVLSAVANDQLFRPPREIPETLEAKDASLPPPLSPEDSYVKINDRVVQVFDSE